MSYVSPTDYHRHKCYFCDYVWEHHNINDTKHGSNGSHECPSCGRCNWSLGIYTGEIKPVLRHGIEPNFIQEPTK